MKLTIVDDVYKTLSLEKSKNTIYITPNGASRYFEGIWYDGITL